MFLNSIIFLFLIIYLLSINFFLKKLKISLDKEANNENHKSLLREDNYTPLSGTFYFLPIILILFYETDIRFVICFFLLSLLGLLADLKIINSYKIRLVFQFIFISSLLIMSKEIFVDTRISFINYSMNFELSRILICTFFFMVLINGFNLIDGTNCLCSLNFFIISIFIFLLNKDLNLEYAKDEIIILVIALFLFLILNFFGKNFLGDGAAYGLGFLFGFFLLDISLINGQVSPYFFANLLWYPAFENLFTIIRRRVSNNNNYLPDNEHLHQLIYKYFKNKDILKNNFLLSSLVGISINSVLLANYLIGFKYYYHTMTQVTLIIFGIFLYVIVYLILKKKISMRNV